MTKLIPEAADDRALKPEKPTVSELMEENARLKDAYDFTMSDHQRLMRKQDVEGICSSPHLCFEQDDWLVRCGPCAIYAAEIAGITVNSKTIGSPQAMRLQREASTLTARIAELEAALHSLEAQAYHVVDGYTVAKTNIINLDGAMKELDQQCANARRALGGKNE